MGLGRNFNGTRHRERKKKVPTLYFFYFQNDCCRNFLKKCNRFMPQNLIYVGSKCRPEQHKTTLPKACAVSVKNAFWRHRHPSIRYTSVGIIKNSFTFFFCFPSNLWGFLVISLIGWLTRKFLV